MKNDLYCKLSNVIIKKAILFLKLVGQRQIIEQQFILNSDYQFGKGMLKIKKHRVQQADSQARISALRNRNPLSSRPVKIKFERLCSQPEMAIENLQYKLCRQQQFTSYSFGCHHKSLNLHRLISNRKYFNELIYQKKNLFLLQSQIKGKCKGNKYNIQSTQYHRQKFKRNIKNNINCQGEKIMASNSHQTLKKQINTKLTRRLIKPSQRSTLRVVTVPNQFKDEEINDIILSPWEDDIFCR